MVTMYIRYRPKKFVFTVFIALICTVFIFENPATSLKVFADTAPTTVNATSNGYTNSKIITGTSGAGYSVDVSIYQGVTTSPSGTLAAQGQITADSNGNWSYNASGLADGEYTAFATGTVTTTVSSTDPTTGAVTTSTSTSSSSSSGVTFTLDTVRPIVLPSLYPLPDAARIPIDTSIKVQLQDNSPLDPDFINTAITLSENNTSVSGTVSYDSGTKQVVFTPSSQLLPFTTYYVDVSPLVSDLAGNLVHPRAWSFTTDETTASGVVNYYSSLNDSQNPHGNYSNNVEICKNCHSPHLGKSPKLSSPNNTNVDNYCMACHDGTNAPLTANWSADTTIHKHDTQVSMDGTKGSSACTSCHNPHLTWDPNIDPNNTNSNSVSLRGYYKYVHSDPTNPTLPSTSEQQLCEACHMPSIKNDSRVTYVQYTYLEQNTATATPDSTTGLPNDYSLCLRCHDGKIGTDIASFYKTTSGHNFQAVDGSSLNGNMPCADCHETHGSTNIKVLKQKLGNNNIQGTFDKTTGDWDAATERIFCLKCHNSSTELYGKTIPFNATISGHTTADTQFCSNCHGGGDPIAGAHAPKKLP